MPDFFKFCPNCKSSRISKNEIKRFSCPDCGFEYYHNVAAACAAILHYNNKIIFVERKYDPAKGMLDLPGGFVDYNEDIEKALTREVQEELNLCVDKLKFLVSFPNQYHFNKINYHTLDFIFTAWIESIDMIKVNDDVSNYYLIEKDKIDLQQIGLTSIKKAMEYYMKNY